MMRIVTLHGSDVVQRLRLEGRVTQQTVPELHATVDPMLEAGAAVVLDLTGLSFADSAAVESLLAMRARGAVLVGCSGFLSELLRGEAGAKPPADAARVASAALLERLRGGDETAFAELVEQNAGRLLATAQRLLRSEDQARDAVQDAFLSAFKNLSTFNGEAKLSTWLHRIVVNAALMRLRSRRHRAELSIDELLPRFAEDGHFADAPAVSSHELLERCETRATVRRCIDRLPESHRTVILMRDIEDLDTDEVAEILGITPNAVKIRLHRARQALRTLIEHDLLDGGANARSRARVPSALHA